MSSSINPVSTKVTIALNTSSGAEVSTGNVTIGSLALDISAKILVLEDGRALSWAAPAETAALICAEKIKGLAMPEILELAKRLKEAGKIEALTWSPDRLADELVSAAGIRGSRRH